jgi:uncharacterized membrane protein
MALSGETRSAMLGVVAGMRSQLPLALLSIRSAAEHDGRRWMGVLASPAAKAVLGALAAGELVGDKLPVVPNRLKLGPFLGRLVFGGVAGSVLAARASDDVIVGAAAGVTGAVIGTMVFSNARVILTRTTGLPDAVFAVAEDGLAILLGLRAVKG